MIFELAKRIKKGTWLDKERCCKYVQVSQDRPCCFQVVALDCASQAIRLGRCHELSSLTMLASIWRVLFGTEWKPGKSAAASGVNLQLSAAIWVWCLGNEWHQQVTKTGHQCHSDHPEDFQVIRRIWATKQTFALSRLVLQRCVGLAMDGNCKTFDTSADGFARGEGMGVETQETRLVFVYT